MSQNANSADLAAQLAKLRQQEAANRDAEVRLNTERESVDRDLQAAKKRAEEEFGTSDLGKMRELYQKYSTEDREAINAYAQSVNNRTALLEDIQKRLTAHRATQSAKV